MNDNALLTILKKFRDEAHGPEGYAFKVLNSFPTEATDIQSLQERTAMQMAAMIRYMQEENILKTEQVDGLLLEMARASGM